MTRHRKELKWPDNGTQTVTYDVEGKVTTYQPRGTDATITNSWNAAQEITGQGWVNGSHSGTASLTRNAAGQIVGVSTIAMTLTVSGSFAYNGEGQVSSASQTVGGLTRAAGITYDLNGEIQTITYPAGFTVEYMRNGDGQVTAIKKDSTTIASYTYDSAGRLSTRTLSNGVVTTYTYDGMDRVDQIMVASGSTALWAERYGYNAAGERIYTLKGSTGTVGDAYWLDATSQLVGVKYGATGANGSYSFASSPVSTATWQYDAAGNRATQVVNSGTTSYTTNDINQYTDVEGSASSEPTYTSRGDLATKGDWEYAYDAFGNLIQAHDTNTNTLAQYWRDAFGHRAVKDVDGNKTVYFNLGYSQLEAYDLTAETTSSTIYESGIDRPLAEVSDGGSLTFYHQDLLGSVVLLTGGSGAKVQSYTFDAWGKPSGFDGTGAPIAESAIVSRFLYTAREFDQETGLYHYRARGYSPEWGRFIQNDPIDFDAGDYNLVRYVYNNPLKWTDPLGLFLWPWQSPTPVRGGTFAERQKVRDALRDVRRTDRGKDLIDEIRKRGEPVDVNVTDEDDAYAECPGDEIWVDPDFSPVVDTTAGPLPASLESIIGHELGHAVTGTADDGPNRMNNVNQNENPIRDGLGEPRRTSY